MPVQQPPPTWAEVTIINEVSGKPQFSPIWLNWFLNLQAAVAAASSGSSGPIPSSAFTMSTNRMLGRTTAGTGAIEEITVTANNGLLFAAQALSIDRALQADMETPTAGNKIVASTVVLYHPGVAKAWCSFDPTGALIGPSYNVGSITDNGVGDWTVNIAGSFPLSSANGTILVNGEDAAPIFTQVVNRASASAYQINCWDITGTLFDPDRINFAIFGDVT